MTENKKYYYFTYMRKGEGIHEYNTAVSDEYPIEFVIKEKGNVILLCVIEITKEQCDNFAYGVRNR